MLKAYQPQNGGLKGTEVLEGMPIAPESVWIDLLNPTITERETVKALLGMDMPTRADMEEIEVSSRLYVEDGGVFMTALVLANSDSDRPVADVVTFVLAREKLITIRYIDPQPFRTFAARCSRTLAPPVLRSMTVALAFARWPRETSAGSSHAKRCRFSVAQSNRAGVLSGIATMSPARRTLGFGRRDRSSALSERS